MPELFPLHVAENHPASDRTERLNLDQLVDDNLLLSTLDGAADWLLSELSGVDDISAVRCRPTSVEGKLQGTLRGLRSCRLYSTAAIPLPGHPDHEPRLEPLSASLRRGVLGAIATRQPLRFRVGVAQPGLREQIIGGVERALGWINDPSSWDVNITTGGDRWLAQVGALHYSQRFGRLERQPWSTTPLVAETLVRLAKLQAGMSVHDPCCGTGTLLVATAQNAPGCQLSGTDHDHVSLALADHNVRRHHVQASLKLANATPIPALTRSVDRVVGNLPFGKQVGSHDDNGTFYPGLLNEISRTLTNQGRAVLLTEDKRLFVDTVQRTKGLKIVRERLLRYGGATPTAYVLARTRR